MNLKKDKPFIINIISMAVLFITLIVNYIFFQGEKTFRILLMAFTLWVLYFFYKRTFLRKSRVSFYLIYSFVVGAMYFGSIFDFYIIIPNYDKILHLLSGLIIGIIGYILFLHVINGEDEGKYKSYMPILFSFMFAVSCAGIWEIWEFSTDKLFGFTSQNNSLNDTMWDIICGTVMGLIANIPLYLHIKGKKIKFIENIIKDMKN